MVRHGKLAGWWAIRKAACSKNVLPLCDGRRPKLLCQTLGPSLRMWISEHLQTGTVPKHCSTS